ncbi:tetratricopeptide repeat protein [Phenylobacterium sp.]|uniref:tetratricopeptide repeat protein n=1 Tax=Phenylobacterium sp. TaxID=1871053 RepID=UPI0011FE17D9|nr:tetratricopeptide repeat protein [Phenylobacterium sp.]THD70533.1 MAG: sel1 repeat family protein [Phenylobacterium sp.]
MDAKITSLLIAGFLSLLICAQAAAGPLEAGQEALRRGEYSGAMTRLLPLADSGDTQAQYEVGRMYEGGQGVAKDYGKAASWYRKSAANGNHQAQLLLSLMFARGQGVPQDDKEGLAWLAKSGEGAPPEKQRAMRMLYYQTRGSYDGGRQLSMAELAARALPGVQQMADQGDPNAKCALLQMYETGQGAPRKGEDLVALRQACAPGRTGSKGLPEIPALPVPSHRP